MKEEGSSYNKGNVVRKRVTDLKIGGRIYEKGDRARKRGT